ncbi:hypothetical protein PRK78_007183 [Emydomyces testavorans]|uniref:Uncharacterized protein n=1 Tax=Emydomyces testavorans TaxID=2070801 RepID=A0AAF0IMG2_9EURO|nr:hypothetical protein PRK78_007183 [Emydomyces testavorans]
MPSATLSETSPSKPIPDRKSVELEFIAWGNSSEAIAWFVHLQDVVQSIVYRYGAAIEKALVIFEESSATAYNDFRELHHHLQSVWNSWKSFKAERQISTEFLRKSILYLDLHAVVKHMKSPRDVATTRGKVMSELRLKTMELASEMQTLRNLVDDVGLRLGEIEDGSPINLFPDLPQPEEVNIDFPRLFRPSSSEQEEELAMISFSTETSEEATVPRDDDDYDDEDDDMQGPRDPAELNPEAFGPVWINGEVFSGELTQDMKDVLEDHDRAVELMGSTRSIFFIEKIDEMVELIDDPAYQLEDEFAVIPCGCQPGSFLLDQYFADGKVPSFVYSKYTYYNPMPGNYSVQVLTARIPRQVTREVATCRLRDMYPRARTQGFPETVRCVSIKHLKSTDRFVAEVQKVFDESFNSKNFLFRGLPLHALEETLVFFIPVLTSQNSDNEFGPGMYTTNQLSHAKDYAGYAGAIMVFKDCDYHHLEVWRPDTDEWRSLIASWLDIPLEHKNLAPEHHTADVIVGPVSKNGWEAKHQKRFPIQGDKTQHVFVSYHGLERLRQSLFAIIYIDNCS